MGAVFGDRYTKSLEPVNGCCDPEIVDSDNRLCPMGHTSGNRFGRKTE